jgi:enoyl-CoA hydratase
MPVLVADADHVRTLTLSRPEALNALTPQLLEELADALRAASEDAAVRVVVLTGEGRAFSAGVDLKALAAQPPTTGDVADLLNNPARRCTELLATMPKVTIAKVNGFCFTGALELALACDLMVVAAEAKLGDTHTKWGLRPTRARELSYTARQITGVEALAYGMASHAAPLAELDATVTELAAAVIANSAEAIAAYKDLYRNAQDRGLSEGLSFEYSTRYPMSGAGSRLDSFGR